jgi:CDP-glycerol glycerophosphotransferase (TagB/SpsB family)
MISLDSPERTSFARRAFRGKVRVIVSSETEAKHFIDLAGFSRNELIVSGLSKFDSSYKNEKADKILIMPTWRIWEFNAMRANPDNTKYVEMIKKIESAIPADLNDKVVTRYHPLFHRSTFNGESNIQQESLDVLLRDVKLLITDYSSIAYDAFYRGANVVFYWEDLDDCMKHYGKPTHLMLNNDSAFGRTCMNKEELADCIRGCYYAPQSEGNLQRYRKIVSYQDGKNTERIIEALEVEGII